MFAKNQHFYFPFSMCLTGAGLRGIFLQKVIFHLQDQLEAQRHKCPLSKKTCFEYRIFFICTRSYWEPANNIRSQIYSLLQHIAFNMCNNFFNNIFSQIWVFELNLRAFHRLDVFRIRLDNWRFGQHCWFDKIAPIPFRIWKSPS